MHTMVTTLQPQYSVLWSVNIYPDLCRDKVQCCRDSFSVVLREAERYKHREHASASRINSLLSSSNFKMQIAVRRNFPSARATSRPRAVNHGRCCVFSGERVRAARGLALKLKPDHGPRYQFGSVIYDNVINHPLSLLQVIVTIMR